MPVVVENMNLFGRLYDQALDGCAFAAMVP
jgi:hypothetical protein